jgi:uncharacterized protein YhhL (DUF1145 family)
MSTAKAVVLVLWLLFFSCFFVATSSTVCFVGRLGFWLLATTHLVECAVFLPRLRRAPGSLVGHLLRTLLFGFLHVREVRALTSQEASQS